MRRSQYFLQTLRDDPAASEVAGHALLLRAGTIAPLSAGIYSFLPLGERVKRKVEKILRSEMEYIGALEISLPVVQPADLWRESGRLNSIGEELVSFNDRTDRPMVLAMTHEEVVADLIRRHVRSYRQLPVVLFQIQTKFRDEPRARGGLIRAREFVMKDAYSCHASYADLDRFYEVMHDAYLRVFARAALDVLPVQADTGMMGGSAAEEFMFLSEIGEDQIAVCDACGYSANRQVANFRRELRGDAIPGTLREVATPGASTIAALVQYLGISSSQTAKATFFVGNDRLIFAVVRGDMEVNETKLANRMGVSVLRPAVPADLQNTGIEPGYASPIGIQGVTVVVDEAVAQAVNLVAGANREGFHYLNTNYGRDYSAEIVADVAAVWEGAPCTRCEAPLRIVKGVEVGNIFKLGTKYADAFGSTYLDESGRAQPIVMGSYGIGVGRLMACVAERWRDEKGLVWPMSLTPFHVYLVGLDLENETVRLCAEQLHVSLEELGIEVLFDDRRERAGVKFNDADLLGFPLRVTISRRTVSGDEIEVTRRATGESTLIPLQNAVSVVAEILNALDRV